MSEDPALAVPASDASLISICGIGASAGGITALRKFFSRVRTDLNLAYVVVVHLAPDHPSALSEILGSCTKMSVNQVEDGPQLKGNCVYVIPPDRELVIDGNSLAARPFSQPRGKRAPIDMLFRSIAAARGDGCAIILSGSGSDGSLGVRAVKEAGGIVLVQEPADAEYAMMPQNAIATGAADFIAPITELTERLADIAQSKESLRSLSFRLQFFVRRAKGRYPRSIEADISDERLHRWFVSDGSHYRVRQELRDVVLFALHSALKDPPFMRLDLITCRNLLIYLDRALQRQLAQIFHYALKANRFLFLGSAEALESTNEQFAPVDRDARIYQARPQQGRALPQRLPLPEPPAALATERLVGSAARFRA